MEHFLCTNIEEAEEEKQHQYLIKISHGLEKILQHTSCTKITSLKWTLDIRTWSYIFLDKNKQYVNVKNYYCYIFLRIYIYPVKITVERECHFILMIISPIHTLKKDLKRTAKTISRSRRNAFNIFLQLNLWVLRTFMPVDFLNGNSCTYILSFPIIFNMQMIWIGS
jgi:hypothetical protein